MLKKNMMWAPNFLAPGSGFMEGNFSTDRVGREWFGYDSGTLHLLCTYFYYYDISFTSDHQALDPRGWGLLPYIISKLMKQQGRAKEKLIGKIKKVHHPRRGYHPKL